MDGQTIKICKNLQNRFNSSLLKSINQIKVEDLEKSDQIIIGASVRYGDHSKSLYGFIKKNKLILESKKTAFFSVNATARKKNEPSTNPYIMKFLKKTNWTPNKLKVFAGKIDFPQYGFFDKNVIKLIMWLTNGPTDTSKSYEFTNWSEVESFARVINKF